MSEPTDRVITLRADIEQRLLPSLESNQLADVVDALLPLVGSIIIQEVVLAGSDAVAVKTRRQVQLEMLAVVVAQFHPPQVEEA